MEITYAAPSPKHPVREVNLSATAVEWRMLATMMRTHKGRVGCQRAPHLRPWEKCLSGVQVEMEPGHKLAIALGTGRTLLITGGTLELNAVADAIEALSNAIHPKREPDYQVRVEFLHEEHFVARESIPAVLTLLARSRQHQVDA